MKDRVASGLEKEIKNAKWHLKLCEANNQMAESSKEEIQRIVDMYPITRKVINLFLPIKDYQATEYFKAVSFLKQYY